MSVRNRLAVAVGKHGLLGFTLVILSLPFLRVAAAFDKLMWNIPCFQDRVRKHAGEIVSANASSPTLRDPNPGDAIYEHYVHNQATKSLRMSSKYSVQKKLSLLLNRYVFRAPMVRVAEIARVASDNLTNISDSPYILSIGCRDELELLTLRKIFNTPHVVGLDLFSLGEHIRVGDMHSLPFSDAYFDVVISCHSLEHAYDPYRALKEFIRVLKESGILAIEVPVVTCSEDRPVEFLTQATDRWNFCNIKVLLAAIRSVADNGVEVVHSSDVHSETGDIKLVAKVGLE